MNGELVAAECAACGRVTFPRRLWCPACGGRSFTPQTVQMGTVEETTIVRRAAGRPDWVAVRIGAVRLDDGQIVIARLERGAGTGQRVQLETREGAPVAGPAG